MGLSNTEEKLRNFRENLYRCFPKRGNAIMNLLDALTSHGRLSNSIVQLSSAPCFQRQYSSITDAIADGLPDADWPSIQKLLYQQQDTPGPSAINRFIIDCTGNPRPHARKLADRHMTHAPNPAPGNKPVTVGHQYSVLTLLPKHDAELKKHWLLPLSAQRVQCHQKGNEIGMTQLADSITSLGLSNQMSISMGDSLYGTERCRVTAAKHDNLVHIFRLNSKRNVFFSPEKSSDAGDNKSKRGRHKEFGAKMNLSIPDSQPSCDRSATTNWVSRRGKQYTVTIKAWDNMLLRGSRTFRSSEHPLNVVRIEVTDESGTSLYKRPLWLAIFGKRRDQVNLIDASENYRARYDIEHFFRFSKRNLLMDAYQTPDVKHEELWWSLCQLAYMQLYLSKSIVSAMPEPWERYLPEYKKKENKTDVVSSPSQTQRGFSQVLDRIGTPARDCVARGKPRGRMTGDFQHRREEKPITFKAKRVVEKPTTCNLSGSDPITNLSDPQKIEQLIQLVRRSLGKWELSPSEFSKILVDSS